MNVEKIITELKKAPENSRLYLGADSVRYQKKDDKTFWAKITVVAVIHLAGKHGCKVIGYSEHEQVFDKNVSRPQYRMMQEVFKLSELYLALSDRMLEEGLEDTDVELHLDIATDERYGSSCAAKQAAGYVLGVCGVEPVMKPVAWAASTAADLYDKKLG